MPRDKTASFKQMAERAFPWRMDIDVPGLALGPRLDVMHTWCRERGCEWDQHGYMRTRPGEVPQDVVRFHFVQDDNALAFKRMWGGDLLCRE